MSVDLQALGASLERALVEWNVPGLGVAVVRDSEVLFSRGHGMRDHEARLPFTPSTLFPIASNTKLFTALIAGMLVEEGRMSWNRPIRETLPSIRFFDDALTSSVTLRDMLAHRTGSIATIRCGRDRRSRVSSSSSGCGTWRRAIRFARISSATN